MREPNRSARWTDKEVKALKLPAGKKEQRVLIEPGLYLYMRRRAAGDTAKQWQYRSQVDGVRRWLSLGAYPAVGLAKAQDGSRPHRTAREAALDAAKGLSPSSSSPSEGLTQGGSPAGAPRDMKGRGGQPGRAARKSAGSRRTVAATFSEWMADKRGGTAPGQGKPVRERTIKALTAQFDRDLRPRIGDTRIAELTREALQACIEGGSDEADAPAAKASTYRTLRGLVAFAMARGYLTGANPMRGIEKPKVQRAADAHVANDAEIVTLLNAVDDSRLWPATKMAIELPLLTGARPTEVRLATWPEFDLAQGLWTIPAGRVQSGREFKVHLSPQAVALLERARAHQQHTGSEVPAAALDVVFKGAKGQAMEKMAVARALARLAKRTEKDGGKKLAPHDLRRSFRGLLDRLGIAPEIAELCMNHPPAHPNRPSLAGETESEAATAEAWNKAGAYIAKLRRGGAGERPRHEG